MLQFNYEKDGKRETLYGAVTEVLKRLNKLRRWTDVLSNGTFNELSKQALNCIICYLLACMAEETGVSINWSRFPRYALYRAFEKVYVLFDTPISNYLEIFEIGNINRKEFDKVTRKNIEENSTGEFADFLRESIGTQEEFIYKAATKIATYIELRQICQNCSPEVYEAKLSNALEDMAEYDDLPGYKELRNTDGKLFKLLSFLSHSGLRHHLRWCTQAYIQETPILGHLFDTACYAYLMALESNPENEELAAQRFFMGIFHDIAEAWTTDIPQPLKNGIPNFRHASEIYEEKFLEKCFYPQLDSPILEAKVREVMFESEENSALHRLPIKIADYLAGTKECWLQLIHGSRDPYFVTASIHAFKSLDGWEDVMPQNAQMLYDTFVQYARETNILQNAYL